MIKIGIVDDHAVVREGLKALFSGFVEFRVAGEASSGREAIDLVRTTELDVLLMDLSMPGQSGIDALGMIRAKAPDLGILVLSAYPEEHYAVNLIRQGASGYLNKDCEPAEIANAIRTVALGRRYITPSVAEILANQLDRKDDAPPHKHLVGTRIRGRCSSSWPRANRWAASATRCRCRSRPRPTARGCSRSCTSTPTAT